MSKFTREGTEALQHLAEEVEKERQEKGHTPFDDVPESDGEDHSFTREDYEGPGDSPEKIDVNNPAVAGSVGHMGRITRPGL